ncbi:MAG: hypothetical protein HC890_11795 [Chloroflexaceae bacterium]|nr:hypothetical protein [Chloroflexaceae bacterium]
MDSLQSHILELDRKVERLNQMVERLGSHITAASIHRENRLSHSTGSNSSLLDCERARTELAIEHKDILVDSNSWENSRQNEQQLSPEIQIRRLTAQLTASYNRIAVLEEQLLACRIHSELT